MPALPTTIARVVVLAPAPVPDVGGGVPADAVLNVSAEPVLNVSAEYVTNTD